METTTKLVLPNSTAVLVLGILSIISCWCYGFPGLVFSIIALVLGKDLNSIYQANPENYTQNSYENFKAGKICAIVGLCLSGIALLIPIIIFFMLGLTFTSFCSGFNW